MVRESFNDLTCCVPSTGAWLLYCNYLSLWKGHRVGAVQFSISMQFSSIWPIDRTLSGVTLPDQCGPGSDDNEGVLCIPQSSSITGTSPWDCLVSYPGHPLAERRAVDVFYSSSWLGKLQVWTFPLLACEVFFRLRYVDIQAMAISGALAIEFWSCNANSNASAWQTFFSRDLSVLALPDLLYPQIGP